MISRILALAALLALVGVAAGGAWYVFRDTPQKRIERWRQEAKYFLEKTTHLEQAEALNDKILQIIPTSAHDLVFKASIRERMGTPESLREALTIYDKILSTGNPDVQGVAFLKARTCRSMGLASEAQGTLLSVVDVFPLEALLELGETSLSTFSANNALKYFTKAREVAESRADIARAQEGMANAYLLLLSLATASSRTSELPAELRAKSQAATGNAADSLRASCKQVLNEALSFLKSDDTPASHTEANRRLVWAATLYEKLGSIKAPGETPLQDGIVQLTGRVKDYSIQGREAPALLVRLGSLRLMAVRDEGAQLQDRGGRLEQEAEEDFNRAMRSSPEEALALLTKPQEAPPADGKEEPSSPSSVAANSTDDVDDYLQRLVAIARIYLQTSQYARLVKDPAPLALARRVSDVVASGYPGAAGVCTMLTGFARIKAGEVAEGNRLIDAYLATLSADSRSLAAVELAEHALRLLPEDPVALQLFDRCLGAGEKPLNFLGKKVGVLIAARSRSALAAEASRRLDDLLTKAVSSLHHPDEFVGVSKILYSVKGRDASAETMRMAASKFPDDRSVRRIYADLLFERSGDASVSPEERAAAGREALGSYFKLFVQAPGESQDVVRRAMEVVSKSDEAGLDSNIAQQLKPLFPGASPAALDSFVFAVRSFFLAQYGPALDRAGAIPDAQSFKPFLGFLKGSCHVGLAAYLSRDALRAGSDAARQSLNTQYREHIQSAMEEFRKEPGFVASSLELANLEFQQLNPGDDVPEDLLKRIQQLSEEKGLEHGGQFLLARAMHKRFQNRYGDKSVKNSDLVRFIVREQKALRNVIRTKPAFIPAYLALAETFIISDSPRDGGEAGVSRQIFTPSFEKAVNIVRSIPNPDEQVASRLAQYYEAMGRSDDAAQYLEQLGATKPSADVFSRLIACYLRKDNPAARVLLDDEPPTAKGPFAKPPLSEALPRLLVLRKSFEALPEYQGLRYMCLAMEAEKSGGLATTSSAKRKLQQEMIAAYEKSLAAFDEKNIKVPLLVLNNLGWFLSEEAEPARKAKGLELATRAKERISGPAESPEIYDTYAWALFQNGRLLDAEQTLSSLLKVDDQPTYRYHRSQILFKMKKLDDALEEIRRARDSTRPFREELAARELESEIKEARRIAIGE